MNAEQRSNIDEQVGHAADHIGAAMSFTDPDTPERRALAQLDEYVQRFADWYLKETP